jgi:PPOX class probable F420-dependent enzyme
MPRGFATAYPPSAGSGGSPTREQVAPGSARSYVWSMTPTVATTTKPDRSGLTAFLRERHRVVLITRRSDGSPQSSPVSCGIDSLGRLLVSTYPERAKVANVRNDPAVSACVLSDDWNGPYVHVDGTAEVLELPEAAEEFVTYFRSISGEHPDWDEYRAAMVRQGKCLIRVTVERWGPIATGGFPARLA